MTAIENVLYIPGLSSATLDANTYLVPYDTAGFLLLETSGDGCLTLFVTSYCDDSVIDTLSPEITRTASFETWMVRLRLPEIGSDAAIASLGNDRSFVPLMGVDGSVLVTGDPLDEYPMVRVFTTVESLAWFAASMAPDVFLHLSELFESRINDMLNEENPLFPEHCDYETTRHEVVVTMLRNFEEVSPTTIAALRTAIRGNEHAFVTTFMPDILDFTACPGMPAELLESLRESGLLHFPLAFPSRDGTVIRNTACDWFTVIFGDAQPGNDGPQPDLVSGVAETLALIETALTSGTEYAVGADAVLSSLQGYVHWIFSARPDGVTFFYQDTV